MLRPVLTEHIIRIKINTCNPLIALNPTKRTWLPGFQCPKPRRRPRRHLDVEIHPWSSMLRPTHHASEDVRVPRPRVADISCFALFPDRFRLVDRRKFHAAASSAGGGGSYAG